MNETKNQQSIYVIYVAFNVLPAAAHGANDAAAIWLHLLARSVSTLETETETRLT